MDNERQDHNSASYNTADFGPDAQLDQEAPSSSLLSGSSASFLNGALVQPDNDHKVVAFMNKRRKVDICASSFGLNDNVNVSSLVGGSPMLSSQSVSLSIETSGHNDSNKLSNPVPFTKTIPTWEEYQKSYKEPPFRSYVPARSLLSNNDMLKTHVNVSNTPSIYQFESISTLANDKFLTSPISDNELPVHLSGFIPSTTLNASKTTSRENFRGVSAKTQPQNFTDSMYSSPQSNAVTKASQQRALLRSKMSEDDKIAVRKRDALRKAASRAAQKVTPASTGYISETNVSKQAQNQQDRKRKQNAKSLTATRASMSNEEHVASQQQNTARRAIARQNLPSTQYDIIRQLDSQHRAIARQNLPSTQYDIIRQVNTQHRAIARQNLPSTQYDIIRQVNTQQRAVARNVIRDRTQVDQRSSLQDHIPGNTMPTNEYLNLFEKDAHAAQARFAIGSGFNVHGDVYMKQLIDSATGAAVLSDEDRHKLINVGPVPENAMLNAVDKFIKYTDASQPIYVCASCGIRGLSNNDASKAFASLNLLNTDGSWNDARFGSKKTTYKTLLEIFEIDESILHEYTDGPYCSIRTCSKLNNKYLYLYDNYLQRNTETGSISMRLCPECRKEVGKGTTPLYSPKYRDIGISSEFQRIVLGKEGRSLSLAERTLCSPAVVFDTIVKTTMTDGKFHKGHCMAFIHDATTEIATTILPRKSLEIDENSKYISMAYVGTTEQWNKIEPYQAKRAEFLRRQPVLVMRAEYVQNYLAFKCKMDPHYAHVDNTTEAQSVEQVASDLLKISDELFDSAVVCDEEREIRLDRDIHDNVAIDGIDDRPNTNPERPVDDNRVSDADTLLALLKRDDNPIIDEPIDDQLDEAHISHVFMSPEMVPRTSTVAGFLSNVHAQCVNRHGESMEGQLMSLVGEHNVNDGPPWTIDDFLEEEERYSAERFGPTWMHFAQVIREIDNGRSPSFYGMSAAPERHLGINPDSIAHNDPLVDNSTHVPVRNSERIVHPVRIGDQPISEYGGGNHELIYNAFPDLFLLGNGLGVPTQRPSLTQRDLNHLLLHADGRFAKSSQFIFFAFNQMQRSILAAQVSVKVRGDSTSMKEFTKISGRPGFLDTMKDHIQNPDTSEAKELAKHLNSITKTVNAKVPWTEHQRASYGSNLLAQIGYSGPFSYFITIAPGHTDSLLRLRISESLNSNEVDALKNIDLVIPSYSKLARSVVNDPVSAAVIYRELMIAFLCFLVGKSPSFLSKRDTPYPPTDSVEAEQYGSGIFGKVSTYGLTNEEQAKGPEHGHMAVTGDTGPLTILKYLDDPAVLKMLTSRMESIVQAHIPNRPRALFLSNILSTKLPSAEDQKLPTRRDQRYNAYESHDNSSILASMDVTRDTKQKSVDESRSGMDVHDFPIQEDSFLASSSAERSRKSTVTSSTRPCKNNVVVRASFEDNNLDLLAELECEKSQHELLTRRALACAVRTNLHNHSFTCHKGEHGKYKCRLGYPKAPCNRETGFVQIERDPSCNLPKARTHFSVKQTALSEDPLQNLRDDRVIVLELFRPSDDYSEELQEQYENSNGQYWADYAPGENSDVVSFSPALTALFACNSNVEVLGNFAQAKGATYYIIKYMTKDGGKIQTILPVLLAAQRKITKYPSTAIDVGTEDRTSKHLLTVLMNSLNGKVEVGAQTAALALLGFPSNVSSHDYGYAFIRPLINFVKKHISEHVVDRMQVLIEDSDTLEPDSMNEGDPLLSSVSYQCTAADSECIRDDNGSSINIADEKGASNSHIFVDDSEVDLNPFSNDDLQDEDDDDENLGDREIIPNRNPGDPVTTMSPSEHYWYRGDGLGHMAYYDYIGCVRVCTKPTKSSKVTPADQEIDSGVPDATNVSGSVESETVVVEDFDDEQNADSDERMLGRQKNAVYDFQDDYSLAKSHLQRLRSKQVIPILAGAPQPKHPGPFKPTSEWRREADRFAQYFLILHRPISARILEDHPEMAVLTYEALIKYVHLLVASNRLIDKARLWWITIATHGMSIKSDHLKLLSAYRGRCTQYWSAEDNYSFDDEPTQGELENDPRLGADLLKDLQDQFGSFDASENPNQAALNAYYDYSNKLLSCLDDKIANESDLHVTETELLQLNSAVDGRLSNNSSSRFLDETDVTSKFDIFRAMRIANRIDQALRDPVMEEDTSEDENDFEAIPSIAPPLLVDRTNEAGGCFIIDETPPPHLNEYQQQAFRASADYFNRVELHRADPVSNAAPDDLLLIITGAGGTGKTEFVKTLSAVINRKGAVVCTAPTGVAAVVLPDGHTVHSAFQIRIDQVKKGDRPYARTRKQQINNRANLQQARFKYADEMRFLVIDEFSMLEANLLAVIDERLREWTGNMNIAFGGVAVILMGDPFQLFPVGKSLISASLESLTAASFVSGTSHRTMMYHKSGLLFNKFRRIDFKISQRCLDPVLERCLLPFRSNVTVDARPVVSSGILKLLKVLKSTDATEDPAFKKAVIVVAGNEQRIKINNARAVALAKEHGKVVIAWRSRLCIADRTLLEKMANHHRTTPEALLAKQDELIMFFVEGAPAIILDNIATEVGVANGTTCTLHSLVLDPLKESTQQHWSNMDLLAPGDIYWLPDDDIPLFVNVEFHHIPAAQWDSALSIVEGRIVVPLPMCKDRECHEAKTGKLKQWNFRYHTFWIELAFAVTYYKVQGQTINRIILDLNHAGSVQKKIDLAAFYVGLSRVRHSDHIRILPLRPDTIKHLRSLHFKDCLIDWCKRGSLEFPL